MQNMPIPNSLNTLAWIGVFVAIEQAVHVIVLFLHSKRPLPFRMLLEPFTFPFGLALVWVFFTSLSIILVPLTNRSNAAILAKALHVFTESLFLMQLSTLFGYIGFAGAVFVVVSIILLFVVTLPCSSSISLASFSGIVFDTANFLAFALFATSRPNDALLWTAIYAFGFHVLYLLTFVAVQKWDMLDEIRGTFRMTGMVFNLFANEIFLRLVQQSQYGSYTGHWIKTEELFQNNDVFVVWVEGGIIIKGLNGMTPRRINPFDPHTTGYNGFYLPILNAIVPIFGSVTVTAFDSMYYQIEWSILFVPSFRTLTPKQQVLPTHVFVLTWNDIRLIYRIIGISLSLYFALS